MSEKMQETMNPSNSISSILPSSPGEQSVIGIENVHYTKEGVPYFGVRLYVATYATGDGIGYTCNDVYIAGVTSQQFRLGPIVTLTYTLTGKFSKCTGCIYKD